MALRTIAGPFWINKVISTILCGASYGSFRRPAQDIDAERASSAAPNGRASRPFFSRHSHSIAQFVSLIAACVIPCSSASDRSSRWLIKGVHLIPTCVMDGSFPQQLACPLEQYRRQSASFPNRQIGAFKELGNELGQRLNHFANILLVRIHY